LNFEARIPRQSSMAATGTAEIAKTGMAINISAPPK
jgi:hypothetical protein